MIGFQLATGCMPPKFAFDAYEDTITEWFKEKAKEIPDFELRNFLLSCVRWQPNNRMRKEKLLLHPYLLMHNVDLEACLSEGKVLGEGIRAIKYTDDSRTQHELVAIETPILTDRIPEGQPLLLFYHNTLVPIIGSANCNGHVIIIAEMPRYHETLGKCLQRGGSASQEAVSKVTGKLYKLKRPSGAAGASMSAIASLRTSSSLILSPWNWWSSSL